MVECPRCGEINNESAIFCKSCYAHIELEVYCRLAAYKRSHIGETIFSKPLKIYDFNKPTEMNPFDLGHRLLLKEQMRDPLMCDIKWIKDQERRQKQEFKRINNLGMQRIRSSMVKEGPSYPITELKPF